MATKTKKVTTADIRAWAQSRGIAVGERGRLSAEVVSAFKKAHRTGK
jgi:ABC-type Fe3+-citrate transport system substrate-binding protein